MKVSVAAAVLQCQKGREDITRQRDLGPKNSVPSASALSDGSVQSIRSGSRRIRRRRRNRATATKGNPAIPLSTWPHRRRNPIPACKAPSRRRPDFERNQAARLAGDDFDAEPVLRQGTHRAASRPIRRSRCDETMALMLHLPGIGGKTDRQRVGLHRETGRRAGRYARGVGYEYPCRERGPQTSYPRSGGRRNASPSSPFS